MSGIRINGQDASESGGQKLPHHRKRDNVQLLLDAMPYMALLMAVDGRVEACNRKAADRLGVSCIQLLGCRIYDFLTQNMAEAIQRHVPEIIKTKAEKTFIDVCHERMFEHTLFPIVAESGETELLAVFSREVTEEIKAKELANVYETLVENSPVGIAHVSLEGSILKANKALSRMHGLDGPEDLAGRFLSDFYSGQSLQTFKKQLLLRKKGVSSRYEVQCPGRDGVVRTLEVHGTPLHCRGGSLDGSIATVVDLTERKKAGDALQKQAATIRALFDATSDGVVVLDREMRIEVVNKEFARRLGHSPDDIVKRHLFDLIPRDEIALRRTERIRSTLDAGKPCRFEDTRGEHHYEHSVYPIFDSDGRAERTALFSRLITERKLAEERLRVKDKAIASAKSGIAMADLKGGIDYVNHSFLRMWGYDDPSEVKGRSLLEFWEQSSSAGDVVAELRTAGSWSGELEGRKKDGSLVEVRLSANLVRDAEGTPLCMMASFLDISEQKQAERDRMFLQKQLAGAQKMKTIGDLSSGIAHDFNNVLTPIVGCGELARLSLDEEHPARRHLDLILEAGRRAADLVNQILIFSREGTTESRPVKIRDMVQESLRFLRASLPATVEIRSQIESDRLMVADPSHIHQVIMNLGTNAARAMEGGVGVLEVRLDDHDVPEQCRQAADHRLSHRTYCRLTVIDDGCGMSEEISSRIFEPHFTTRNQGEGSGLGLNVVSSIVSGYMGCIKVKSAPGEGTRFEIILPAVCPVDLPRPNVTSAVEQNVTSAVERGTEAIVFVDDEPGIIEWAEEMLAELGYRVSAFTDPLLALARVRTNPDWYDILVTDLTMPGMLGTELASEIHAVRRDIPILLCSGNPASVSRSLLDSLDVETCLKKPVSRQNMARAIRRVLDRKTKRGV